MPRRRTAHGKPPDAIRPRAQRARHPVSVQADPNAPRHRLAPRPPASRPSPTGARRRERLLRASVVSLWTPPNEYRRALDASRADYAELLRSIGMKQEG
jgi:hypothetical protein